MSQINDKQWLNRPMSRRQLLKFGATAGAMTLLVACVPETPASSADELLARGNSIPLDRLIAEAQREGRLTTIALPHDWANYGEVIETFKTKYALQINELIPEGGSGDEIDAVKEWRDKKRSEAEAPDVLDVGMGFIESSKAEGLFTKYKVATWDTIPDDAKDPEGYWYGDYYGVLAFEVNLDIIKTLPQDWPDLLNPEYKDKVTLAGDPTKSSQAIYSVWAAGLAMTGSLDDAPMAGLEFFAKLYQIGNFVPTTTDKEGNVIPLIAGTDTIRTGETPLVIQWDYLALANRDEMKGEPDLAIIVPRSGVLGGSYAQAVSAYAPHPFAARLWMEFLYSDEGQLLWLEGYVHPIRYNDLTRRYKVPAELAAKLPPAEHYTKAAFPSIAQITQAQKIITENWAPVVLRAKD